ncbi:hypothetical protein CALCODRAFT_266267 [Calocera cornea HHB12733]|uniref:Uncharacterized protein n=1 Tax=Calocera cornea HHB12733 TaxID=1353952 RepID=A0A165GAG7_9BASI|nr:hypothetical protein CALCODRAFT_266267 [Calocera cornea HHB12733]
MVPSLHSTNFDRTLDPYHSSSFNPRLPPLHHRATTRSSRHHVISAPGPLQLSRLVYKKSTKPCPISADPTYQAFANDSPHRTLQPSLPLILSLSERPPLVFTKFQGPYAVHASRDNTLFFDSFSRFPVSAARQVVSPSLMDSRRHAEIVNVVEYHVRTLRSPYLLYT